jgi:hypothetical protein
MAQGECLRMWLFTICFLYVLGFILRSLLQHQSRIGLAIFMGCLALSWCLLPVLSRVQARVDNNTRLREAVVFWHSVLICFAVASVVPFAGAGFYIIVLTKYQP